MFTSRKDLKSTNNTLPPVKTSRGQIRRSLATDLDDKIDVFGEFVSIDEDGLSVKHTELPLILSPSERSASNIELIGARAELPPIDRHPKRAWKSEQELDNYLPSIRTPHGITLKEAQKITRDEKRASRYSFLSPIDYPRMRNRQTPVVESDLVVDNSPDFNSIKS